MFAAKINPVKIFSEISRLIVGFVFFFSGFVKAVDPLGFTYKIQDYLVAFNMSVLFPLAKPAAILMVVLELLIGLFLLLGIYRKLFSVLAALFMTVFLPLTLWIALKNPVEDCGCFGDALIISNWATFYKNIVLSICAFYLLKGYRHITPLFLSKTSNIAALYIILFAVSFSIYNTIRLPVFDFRPFKIGADIAEQMVIDPEKGDVTENVFIYSKDGVEKEFTEDDYPWDDSTWTYVDMETRTIIEGEKPKIEDFHLTLYAYDEEQEAYYPEEDITEQVLEESGYTFLMVSPFLNEMVSSFAERFYQASVSAKENDVSFYLLTSSSDKEIKEWCESFGYDFDFVMADERVLMTMIRTNPGLILLNDGKVVNKWDGYSLPDFSARDIDNYNISASINMYLWRKGIIIFALLIIPLFALWTINRRKS